MICLSLRVSGLRKRVIPIIPLTKIAQVGIMGITNIGGDAMGQEELMNKIAELEREIAILPEGSITKKKIKDKEYYYHRITINGQRTQTYLGFAEVPEL